MKKEIELKYNILNCVPYQICPVCNGAGQVVAHGFTSSVYETCTVCHGAKIIPMHILSYQLIKQEGESRQ